MLPSGRTLLQRDGWLAFHDEPIKILGQENGNRLRHGAHNPRLESLRLIEKGERPVLENQISIENKQAGFHGL